MNDNYSVLTSHLCILFPPNFLSCTLCCYPIVSSKCRLWALRASSLVLVHISIHYICMSSDIEVSWRKSLQPTLQLAYQDSLNSYQRNLALNSLPEYQSCLETKSKDWRNTDILYCRISMLIYQYHVFTFVLSRWLALCSANSITRYPDNIICLGTTLPISTQEWKECFSTFSVLAGFQWGKSLIYCHISCE